MKTKNGMHICLATSLVLATSMQVDVHSTKAKDKVKPKTVEVEYIEVDYSLEDQQILQTKTEVRKQEYIRKQKLIEQERKRKEQERQKVERERQREQQRIAKEKEQNKQVFNKQRKINVVATFYTATCEGCTGLVYANGYNVRNTIYYKGLRIIASDNSLIPLYSIVRVDTETDSFKAIVLDRGSGIKNFEIDVLVKSENEANKLGRQKATVTILREGGR